MKQDGTDKAIGGVALLSWLLMLYGLAAQVGRHFGVEAGEIGFLASMVGMLGFLNHGALKALRADFLAQSKVAADVESPRR